MKRTRLLFLKISVTSFFSIFLISAEIAFGDILCEVKNSSKRLALTFDDGPDPNITPKILALLAQHGARATFFVIGENAKKFPLILKATFDAGHEIGNHNFKHHNLTKIGESKICREIHAAQNAVFEVTKKWPVYFRPPYSAIGKRICDVIESCGVKVVLGSLSSRDYTGLSASAIADLVLSDIKPGAIVIFHDHEGRENTVEALAIILQKLCERGFECVTLSELEEKK